MSKLRYSDFADRIDVDAFEEAIGWERIDTDARGNDYGYCPWPENHSHGDTTGKFAIHREERIYNCWVCGGGDLKSLVMELYDFDEDEAVDFLYQFAHGDLRTDGEFLDDFMAAFQDAEKRVQTLPYFNARVLDKFDGDPMEALEWDKESETYVPWMERRCVFLEIMEQYGVRYAPENIKKPPVKGKFADEDWYVGPALVFPHYWQGRLVGWQNRWLREDRPEWVGKWTNTSGFPKEYTIYGYDEARKADPDQPVVVVESVATTLFIRSLTMLGLNIASVCTFGSSVNEPQMRLLRRFTGGVILAPDNDKAGEKWLAANTNYLKRFIPVWHLPPLDGGLGADLGDLASSDDPVEAVEEHLKKAFRPEVTF